MDSGQSTVDYHYYHTDHLGSSNVITDQTGAQTAHYEYSPYGTITVNQDTTSPVTSYLFTGKELDNSGLYFYGARYYDSEIGRFVSADTIVQAPYDPQSLNRYAYCRNNPLKYTDPSGHWWFIIALIIKFAIAHPIITAGIVGAIVNVASNAGNIHNFGDFAKFAAIGAAAGAAGAGVGLGVGCGFWGMVAGSFTGGFVGGAGNAGAQGASFGQALAFGAEAGAIAAVSAAVLYGAAKVAEKIVGAVTNASKARAAAVGIKTPITQQNQNSAIGKSRVTLKTNYDIEGKPVSFDLVPDGPTVYRQGTFIGESSIKGGQWATENPASTHNYAQKYGLPAENTGRPDWIVKGRIVGEYGQGPAPASYNNPANTGGATEIRPNNLKNDIQLDWFHMPDD